MDSVQRKYGQNDYSIFENFFFLGWSFHHEDNEEIHYQFRVLMHQL